MREFLKTKPIVLERTDELLNWLSDNNQSYKNLKNEIIEKRDKLKDELDEETWNKVKNVIQLYIKMNNAESIFLYCQGIKDSVGLLYHLDYGEVNSMLNQDCNETDFF